MAVASNLNTRTAEAGSDLSADQYKFVTLAADNQIDVNTDAGARDTAVLGVLQNDPDAAGRAATVAVGGVTKVIAGTGGIATGDIVTSDAAGGAIVATTGTIALGVCTVAAAATEIGSIDLDAAIAGSLMT